MVYLEKFVLPNVQKEESLINKKYEENGNYIDNVYPCGIFGKNDLRELDFEPVTILYGGNGSGKSTLLNLISNKLELARIAPYNDSELFQRYVECCAYRLGDAEDGKKLRIPNGSKIITSDDIFDYMLAVRGNNAEIAEKTEDVKQDYLSLKYGRTIKMSGLADLDALRQQVETRRRSKSRRKYVYSALGREVKLNSNGETAIQYFVKQLRSDTLYCLDEPENSLSPLLQTELIRQIEDMTRYCGCQFIIATHSPFVLSLDRAKIYDLDNDPVTVKKWWELENVKLYFEFFESHRDKFQK